MIHIRAACRADILRLMEIAGHSATAAHWTHETYAGLFESYKPEVLALVIEEDSQVVGFVAGRQLTNEEWEIENVAVSGVARRRGLGSRLLSEFINGVRTRGGSEIFLEVRESNHAALALYEKWGFMEVGVRKSYYESPTEDALVLGLSFPKAV